MKPRSITLELPDGSSPTIEVPSGRDDSSLADLLEAKGYRLNTRCGGRGLCRGCQVTCQSKGHSESFRSCQTQLHALPAGPLRLVIPRTSWHDQTLHGVSFFEIHLPDSIPRRQSKALALALDIGTTTLAGALWDLSTGQCLAHTALANPQRPYGDNVLSRISYSVEHPDGCAKLQKALVDQGLKPLIETLARQAKIPAASIETATVAGNPVMLHTLLACRLEGLSTYPFRPVFLDARTLPAAEIGLEAGFTLELLPSLGPFVGADIVAGALAAGMLNEAGPSLLIDFGTNGEILLHHAGRFHATATAAGPAFEGGRLSCGASASGRVISSLSHCPSSWTYRLCDGSGGDPSGISGSAYIDFLAQALDSGLVNTFGRFDRNHPDVSTHLVDGETEHIVRFSPEIWISEPDVAEILQAKAAIGAGVQVLLELAGLDAADLKTIFVAGGFGYHLDPRHAMRVGLLPEVTQERIEIIGNAALGGASLALQADFSAAIQALRSQCQVVELNQIPSFSDHYMDALTLEPLE
ncbi:MAG: DUF4445 domain-containing protein [Verrucomicrobia bacterium]|jgi:uncharacterized 2Fe-2S/4Fe-4S cluster protein (DUF4445 family)|nr:DUF4445 domain-containing protein [Verrucomicrobiota bacterium]